MVSILKLNCPDAVGLLAQITGAISNHGGNLLEVSQYTDVNTGWFFARLAIEKGREHWNADAFARWGLPLVVVASRHSSKRRWNSAAFWPNAPTP